MTLVWEESKYDHNNWTFMIILAIKLYIQRVNNQFNKYDNKSHAKP